MRYGPDRENCRMSMFIDTDTRDKYLIIRIKGRIGGESSIDFYKVIKGIVDDEPDNDVIIDFAEVDFIDSSGLGSLVAINSHLVKVGRTLILSGVLDNLLGLLKITNLHTILKIVDTVDDALD